MKLTCNREQLQAAFAIAANVAPTRAPKPILANVRLDASGSQLVLTATDLEFSVSVTCEAEVKTAGSLIVPTKRFSKILADEKSDHVQIVATASGFAIKADRSEFKLPSENVDDFPPVKTDAAADYFVVTAESFRLGVARTVFAIDEESSRYALQGVLFEIDRKLTLVGCDGRRMGVHECNLIEAGKPDKHEGGTIVVPARALKLLYRTIADNAGDVHLWLSGNDIHFACGNATYTSRLVEGRFPRWRDVLPRYTQATKLQLKADSWLSPLRQVAAISTDDERKVDLEFVSGSVQFAARNTTGESQVEVPCEYSGQPEGVSLDGLFCREWLTTVDADDPVTLEVDGSEAAALWSSGSSKYVVMPLSKNR